VFPDIPTKSDTTPNVQDAVAGKFREYVDLSLFSSIPPE
jgi:hypothetical protein